MLRVSVTEKKQRGQPQLVLPPEPGMEHTLLSDEH